MGTLDWEFPSGGEKKRNFQSNTSYKMFNYLRKFRMRFHISLPHCKIHGSNSKQGEGVHFDHDGHKCHVQQHLNKACRFEMRP